MKEKIFSSLNIRKGEESPILLLLLFSFFMGGASAFFYTAATSLFLENFDTKMLSYAYIASGVTGYLIWVISSKIEKKFTIQHLLITYLVLLTVSVMLFSLSEYFFPFRWLSFLMYVWIRAFTFIGAVVFWILAGRLFDLRQGKRLFGLISSGEVISDIIGFFSIPILLQIISASDLIFIAFIALLLCVAILIYITKVFKSQLSSKSIQVNSETPAISSSLFGLLKTKYFAYLFFLALLPMFAIYYVDYLFLDQTKLEFPDRNVLASFLGVFFGITAIAEFILKTFLSGRLISKYGIKLGLSILPIILGVCALFAILSGSIFGTTAMFFGFIALMKLSERVLRSSLTDPSFQILYQPLPTEERYTFQSKMEGIPKGIGNVIGGFTLLLFTNLSFMNNIHYTLIFLLVLTGWIKIALNMYSEYRSTLKKILTSRKSIENAEVPSNSLQLIKKEFEYSDGDFLVDLNRLFDRIDPLELDDFLPAMLLRGSKSQKHVLLKLIKDKSILTSIDEVELLLSRDNLHDLYNQLKEAEVYLKINEQIGLSDLTQLCESDSRNDRMLAAQLLGYSGRFDSIKLIQLLLADDDYLVRNAAIVACGKIKRVELWDNVLQLISIPAFSNSATSVLKVIGEPIVKSINNVFGKLTTDNNTKLRLIKVLEKIESKSAIETLHSKMNDTDKNIRDRILMALGRLNYKATNSEFPFIKQTIEDEIGITVWLMSSIIDCREFAHTNHLISALESELKNKRERIFLFLSVLYDYQTIQHVLENIESGDNEKKVYALEILDLIVVPEIKEMLIPLLEDVSYEERIVLFDSVFPQVKLGIDDRLIGIINKDYSLINKWTKVCAIELTKYYKNENTLQTLSANLLHPDFLIYENSARTLIAINPLFFRELFDNFPIDIQKKLSSIQTNNLLLATDEVKLLKSLPIFSNVDEIKLVEIVNGSFEIPKSQGELIPHFENYMYYYFVIVNGSIVCKSRNCDDKIFSQHSVIGEFNYAEYLQDGNEFYALEETLILQFRLDVLYSYLDDDINLAGGIINSLYEKHQFKEAEYDTV